MKTILVVDDAPVFREPIEEVLRQNNFETLAACNGRQAIAMLSGRVPDLVLLDLGMPEVDGMEVLAHIRSTASLYRVPVLILSAEADRGRIVDAGKLGISGYVLKSAFSLRDLLARIKAITAAGTARERGTPPPALAKIAAIHAGAAAMPTPKHAGAEASTARPDPPLVPSGIKLAAEGSQTARVTIGKAELMRRVRACSELHGLSPAVSQVVKLTSNPNCQSDEVAKVIAQDQAMAIKILKVANSSAYTRGKPVDSLQKAVVRIGMGCIRQTVMGISVVDRFSGTAFDGYLDTAHFWEHSIACAIIGAEIAHAMRTNDPEAAFAAGLMHDVGRVVLAEQLGSHYTQVISNARELGVPLEQAERRLLSATHADVMEDLLRAWHFPADLVTPILLHQASCGQIKATAGRQVTETLRLALADRLAHALMLGSSGNDTVYSTVELCRELEINADVFARITGAAQQQTDDLKFAMLAWTNGRAWPRVAERVRAELGGRFCPLFVSEDEDVDAIGRFCATVSEPVSNEVPTVVVMHALRAATLISTYARVKAAEEARGVKQLPILLLSPPQHPTALDSGVMEGRKWRHLSVPFTIGHFVAAIHELVGESSARVAA